MLRRCGRLFGLIDQTAGSLVIYVTSNKTMPCVIFKILNVLSEWTILKVFFRDFTISKKIIVNSYNCVKWDFTHRVRMAKYECSG